MSHLCHAHGCDREVPPRMLMCAPHWRRLPRATQQAIWREYRPGQERTKDPSARYMAVQRLAVAQVAFRPNDENAARAAAPYMRDAMRWRAAAIERGEGDPLAGLVREDAQGDE